MFEMILSPQDEKKIKNIFFEGVIEQEMDFNMRSLII